ncbi:ammonium transporter Rh type B-B-like [Tubulanus polymorphus]|uniref:ammonium transporter Rh type B-B-like n=1 Tax=Tubulanus polymorphus TaxID=672921 RepID=UPI003DA43262
MSVSAAQRGKFPGVVLVLQVIFIVLFAVFVRYDDQANASKKENSLDPGKGGADPEKNSLKQYYPMFQDVHVMIFIGFGFLMTFLKKYGFGSVGFNFLIGAVCLQWATLMSGFLHLHHNTIVVSITSLISADFATAAVLITFGALLGKTSPLQLVFITVVEIVVFTINEYIGLKYLKVADIGGSMFVHVFGAYFGLAASRMLFNKDVHKESSREGSNYHSDIFAMIGTLFLWLFWPSFNAALAPGDDQQRAVINTYYALAACCLTTFALSYVINGEAKLDMVHIQNSTLAGGVAVGTSADMMIQPWGAIMIGTVAAIVSVVGFKFLTPFLSDRLKIHDTCGVNNLHGMPGILAAIAGAVAAGVASSSTYGNSLYEVFPARAPAVNSTALNDINKELGIEGGLNRSAGVQAGYQIAALAMTLGSSIGGGAITGLLAKISFFEPQTGGDIFSDKRYWEVPADEEAVSVRYVSNGRPEDPEKAEHLLAETELNTTDLNEEQPTD